MLISVLLACLILVQAKVAGKASHSVGFPEFDENVPMIDKAVIDPGWDKVVSNKMPSASKGLGLCS